MLALRPTRLAMLVLAIVLGGMSWIYAQQRQTAGTLTTQDYIDIQMLYGQYNFAFDFGNAEEWVALFTPDGALNRVRGHDDLLTFSSRGREARAKGTGHRHVISNLVIKGTPEGATGQCYLMMVNPTVKPAAITLTETYEDHLVKTPQGWRFKTRMTMSDEVATSYSRVPRTTLPDPLARR